MNFNRLLLKAKEKLAAVLSESPVQSFSAEHPESILFFVASNGRERAHVTIATGASFEESWASGVAALKGWRLKGAQTPVWLRVEAVHSIETLTWQNLKARLKIAKRNYFRFGLALTADFKTAMLEHELYANALLYKTDIGVATANAVNLKHYGKKRFGRELEWPVHEQDMIWRFKTRAVFTDGKETHIIEHDGRNSGYRLVEKWDKETVTDIVETSTEYLSKQVKNDGEYHYGWFPCFDRAIPTYNALRHASSTYALLEGWEVTQERKHKRAIDRALDYLTHQLIKTVELPDGTTAAFLIDLGDEIKLGGNAVCILAYAKYTEITADNTYLELMEQLAAGIVFMQKPDTGQYVHILNYPDLSVKAEHRIIYYDGEAAFGLMRLYGITKDPRWLASVEKAFDYFIEKEHWKAHDHWLSYCVNELTLYNPDPKYYTFGLDNVRDHLDFVLTRITTFPTLLELMMAAQRMIERMQNNASVAHLLDNFDVDKFYRALEYRARYLLNGFFYPEVAMFFQNPARILGGFFIRHHTFRVRIDDVEHYLSGYVAYRKYLKSAKRQLPEQSQPPQPRKPRALPSDKVLMHEQQQDVASKRIGYLCYPKTPRHFLEVSEVAMQAHTKGIELVYFSYNDFDYQSGKIKGYLYKNGEWEQGYYSLPAVIDNAPANNKAQRAIYGRLLEVSNLLCRSIGGKSKTLPLIYNSEKLQNICIPSIDFSFVEFVRFLEENNKVVLKHKRSSQGKNISLIEKKQKNYLVRNDELALTLTEAALEEKFKKLTSKSWMVQKYIESITPDEGCPFDVRVTVYRQSDKNWVVANPYVRVGKSGISSNLATGGSSIDAEGFLQELYPKKFKKIISNLTNKALAIATELQKEYDFQIDAVGCDFGIEDGELFLFEVNSYPGMKGNMKQAAQLKTNYYVSFFK